MIVVVVVLLLAAGGRTAKLRSHSIAELSKNMFLIVKIKNINVPTNIAVTITNTSKYA